METQYFDVNPMQIFWDIWGANQIFSPAALVLVLKERPFFKIKHNMFWQSVDGGRPQT